MRRLLVRLYPKAWRAEYGEEFLAVLEARPLRTRVVLDVLWSAVRQRWREEEPARIIGLVLLSQMLIFLAVNMTFPGPYERNTLTLNWPTDLVLGFAGCWTALRGGKPARAAMRAQLTCTWPLIVVGFLALIGALPVLVLGPGDQPTTVFERGVALTYYDSMRRNPAPAGLMMLPIFQLPASALYGWLGGLLARGQKRWFSRESHRVRQR